MPSMYIKDTELILIMTCNIAVTFLSTLLMIYVFPKKQISGIYSFIMSCNACLTTLFIFCHFKPYTHLIGALGVGVSLTLISLFIGFVLGIIIEIKFIDFNLVHAIRNIVLSATILTIITGLLVSLTRNESTS